MARKSGAPAAGNDESRQDRDEDDVIDFVPAGSLPPPQNGPAPGVETDAERRTEDLWERMLGTDDAGTGYVTVHRTLAGAGSSEEFVEKIPSDKYDYDSLLEYLRDNYGGGDYRVRLYVKHPRGNFVLRGNRMASIAKRTNSVTSPVSREIVARGGNTDMAGVLATFNEMQARSQQQMQEMMDRMMRRMERQPDVQRNNALEFVEILAGLTAAITPVVTLMVNTKKRETSPVDDLAKILAMTGQIKGLMPQNDAPEEPMWVGVVKEGLKVLPDVLAARAGAARLALPNKQVRSQRSVRGPQVEVPPMTDEVPDAVSPEPTGDVPVDGVDRGLGVTNHPLHSLVCDVLDAAASGSDPSAVAEGIIQNAESDVHRQVVGQFFGQDGLIRELSAIHPGVLDEVEWVLDLRDAVLDLLGEGQEGYPPANTEDSGHNNGAGD